MKNKNFIKIACYVGTVHLILPIVATLGTYGTQLL